MSPTTINLEKMNFTTLLAVAQRYLAAWREWERMRHSFDGDDFVVWRKQEQSSYQALEKAVVRAGMNVKLDQPYNPTYSTDDKRKVKVAYFLGRIVYYRQKDQQQNYLGFPVGLAEAVELMNEGARRPRKRRRKPEKKNTPLTDKQRDAVELAQHGGSITAAVKAAGNGKSRQNLAKHVKKAMAKLGKGMSRHPKPKIQALPTDHGGQSTIHDPAGQSPPQAAE